MILSHRHHLIFIHVHRTGGSAFSSALQASYLMELVESGQHDNAKTDESDFLKKYPSYFTFGGIRNPWERILSWYMVYFKSDRKSLKEERLSFEQFLLNDHINAKNDPYFHYCQLDYFTTKEGRLITENFYRFENYEEEIQKLITQLNLQIQLPKRLNQSLERNNYQDYFTEKSKNFITELCRRDIDYFGYTF